MKTLALNGGGMSGYRTARFLQHLEEETHIQCWRLFDMVSGVSAGSIVAALLAKKMPACEICELFKEFSKRVFGKSHTFLTRLFCNPQYPFKGLESIIREHIDYKMDDSALKLMIYALQIDGPEIKPRHWKSWNDSEINVADAVLASSVAPSFFKPYTFNDIDDGVSLSKTFTDGGIITNNPSMSVISEAISLGDSLDSLYVLNVANGATPGIDPKKFVSLYGVASNYPFISIAAAERCDEYQAHQLIGFRNHVVMPDTFTGVTSTDYSLMDDCAQRMWEEHGQTIVNSLSEV